VRPDALIQICACASLPNLAWLPFTDQPVTADPDGPAQVRWRTKVLKAIYGPQAPVYADHVELTACRREGERLLCFGTNFATALGVGAVPGSRFVWPPAADYEDVALSADRERHFRKWLDIYRAERLAKGTFRNLYVHGFDVPEGYAVEKDGRIYYAFYADPPQTDYRGTLTLRGLLPAHTYRVLDRDSGRSQGTVRGPTASLRVQFKRHLLLMAIPQ
jgi:alpha-galactosidase